MLILLISAPSVFIVVAAYIIYESQQGQSEIRWNRIGTASALLICACISFVIGLAVGFSYGVFFVFVLATIVALLSGIFLGAYLTRWQKLFGLFIGLGFPLIMLLSIYLGLYFDPDSIIERNGDAIAGALYEYHTDKGLYPENLEDLVPTYIDDLKDPGTMWGWLYVSTKDDFTLGYVNDIDSMGYGICKYSPDIPEWDCVDDYSEEPFRSTEPFHLEPTPTPEPSPHEKFLNLIPS